MAVRPRTSRARRLRREASDAERVLWHALRELNLPVKIRRQHPIGRYVADFAIPARKLVIEIDGGQHAGSVGADAERTLTLNARGYRVIRFWNNEVLGNLRGVLKTIIAELEKSPTSP
jgi:very-short-patch-repair endonuclease